MSVSKNPTLTHVPLSESLDTLFCNLIALTDVVVVVFVFTFFLPRDGGTA